MSRCRRCSRGMRCAILILALTLGGCFAFPIKEADCRPASWKQKGYDDGYFGNYPQDYRLMDECARFGVKVAQAEYLEGWRAGYDEYDRLIGSFKKVGN